MKSERLTLDAEAHGGTAAVEDMSTSPSVQVPLTADAPPTPSDQCEDDDAFNEDMVTIDVNADRTNADGNADLPRLRPNAVKPLDGLASAAAPKKIPAAPRRPRQRTQNALIVISTLGEDGPVESSINTLPLEIQAAFRFKVLGLFTLHLLGLSLLVITFTYSPLAADSFTRFADDDTGIALGGSFFLSLGVLLVLHWLKVFFPFNFVLLAIFTGTQAICVTGFGLFYDTKASVLVCLVLFFVMATMTLLSTRRWTTTHTGRPTLVHSLAAGGAAYALVTIVACIVFGTHGTGLMTSTTFGVAMFFTFGVVMWFAFDAHCMYQIMTPDEYMSGVIFFYTDLLLFVVFVVVMIACVAMCDGGAPMACFGGSLGVNLDPIQDETQYGAPREVETVAPAPTDATDVDSPTASTVVSEA
ncbi:Aste57867_10592 [Aphanomyces stellatus]|uniref:Aste57867_10592 protein n=1 Tax=Aphanomyces stellatus TaxID=120398 RepID=A0A485KSA8_9STRA|nr:hypothetical protein As57867_010552 [Aphanomyces stellatus]VFT87464.1 Aste57867_10592 [Aphanomyces stellatus]